MSRFTPTWSPIHLRLTEETANVKQPPRTTVSGYGLEYWCWLQSCSTGSSASVLSAALQTRSTVDFRYDKNNTRPFIVLLKGFLQSIFGPGPESPSIALRGLLYFCDIGLYYCRRSNRYNAGASDVQTLPHCIYAEVVLLAGDVIWHCQRSATFGATAWQHFAAIFGGHSLTEAVLVNSTAVRGLKCSFHFWYIDLFISYFRGAKLGNIFHFHKFQTIFLWLANIYPPSKRTKMFQIFLFFINFAPYYRPCANCGAVAR